MLFQGPSCKCDLISAIKWDQWGLPDYFKNSSKLLEKYDESWRLGDSECWISECSFPLPLCILCTAAVLLKAERCDAVWPVWSMWSMWLSFGAIRKKTSRHQACVILVSTDVASRRLDVAQRPAAVAQIQGTKRSARRLVPCQSSNTGCVCGKFIRSNLIKHV